MGTHLLCAPRMPCRDALLCPASSCQKYFIMGRANFYAHMSDMMMTKNFPSVESSRMYDVTGHFQTILCQEGLDLELVSDGSDDDYLCTEEGNEDEE